MNLALFDIVYLLLSGAVAGLLAGLLGVGGGIIVVPLLAWLFSSNPNIPNAHLMQIALGTSLATIVFTSISSIWAHQLRKAIHWTIVGKLTPSLILGTAVGAILVGYLSSHTLKMIFAIFLLLIAAQLVFGAQPSPQRQLPKWNVIALVGLVIGALSSIVGIGGGSLTVPFLIACNIPIRHAVATSAACGLPIALAGTLGYIAIGWQDSFTGSTGYVYWPAVLAIVPTCLLFAPLGAKLAHTVPVGLLKRFFAVFLAVVGIKMLLF